MTRKKLGKGLDALLSRGSPSDVAPVGTSAPAKQPEQPTTTAEGALAVSINDVKPSPFQPRRTFDPSALAELSASIARHGVLQPIVVRGLPQGGYELIAGERRWRAAQQAGLQSIPAVRRDVSDKEASAFALIENIQRENLNVVEEALGLSRLRAEFGLTQQELAQVVGKSRAAVANSLRLLNLGNTTRDLLMTGKLDMGHARALLGLTGTQQDQVAQEVVAKLLSVRQTEALVRKLVNQDASTSNKPQIKDADTALLERRLTDHLGAKVNIAQHQGGRGEMIIRYSNLDELDGLIQRLRLPE